MERQEEVKGGAGGGEGRKKGGGACSMDGMSGLVIQGFVEEEDALEKVMSDNILRDSSS